MPKLLNVDANAKTVKGQKKGYLTAVLYLAPANLSGFEVCPMASPGCREACLNTAGRAGIIAAGETTNVIQQSRITKTRLYFENREAFMLQLVRETVAFVAKADRMELTPAQRLNGTSDIPWERVKIGGAAAAWLSAKTGIDHAATETMFDAFPHQFYDYTKRANRRDLPANYHLTYSLAEDNDVLAENALLNGMNVAAVFRKELPARFTLVEHTFDVVDGDENDLRFLDPAGVIMGLKAKGKARSDTTGFVRAA